MKKVVSVSLGSSKRNHSVEIELLGEKIQIERIGTDGDLKKAIALLKQLDGTVDAIGLGGINIYLFVCEKRYMLRDAKKLLSAVTKTLVVDGCGLKMTLEKLAIQKLQEAGFSFKGKKVLMVSAVDRWGMMEALNDAGAEVIYGDLIFGLGLPFPLRTYKTFLLAAKIVVPMVVQMPIKIIYPTGKDQEKEPDIKYSKYYEEADVIAGDYLFIHKHMPANMKGKWLLTNTITTSDLEEIKARGVEYLFTTTPEFQGRSFGTNVLEAAFVSLIGKRPEDIKPQEYLDMLQKMGYQPRIEKLETI